MTVGAATAIWHRTASALGGTNAAKESLGWLAVPASGAFVLATIAVLIVLLVRPTPFLRPDDSGESKPRNKIAASGEHWPTFVDFVELRSIPGDRLAAHQPHGVARALLHGGPPRRSRMNPFTLLKSLFTSAPRFAAADCMARVRAGDAWLIDVREPHEWAGGVAERAVLLPLSDLTGPRAQWRTFLGATSGRELLLYCGAGVRSSIAARILRNEGFRAANAGSFAEWSAAGWMVVAPGAKR